MLNFCDISAKQELNWYGCAVSLVCVLLLLRIQSQQSHTS